MPVSPFHTEEEQARSQEAEVVSLTYQFTSKILLCNVSNFKIVVREKVSFSTVILLIFKSSNLLEEKDPHGMGHVWKLEDNLLKSE